MVLVHWPEFRKTMIQGSTQGVTREAPNEYWDAQVQKRPQETILRIRIDGLTALVRFQEIRIPGSTQGVTQETAHDILKTYGLCSFVT